MSIPTDLICPVCGHLDHSHPFYAGGKWWCATCWLERRSGNRPVLTEMQYREEANALRDLSPLIEKPTVVT